MPNRYTGAADQWSKGVASGGTRWIDGVGTVTESPTQGAKRAKQKMIDGFQASMNNGNFDRGCDRVTAQTWQQACKSRQGNYTASAASKKVKYANYIQQAQGELQSINDRINQMPGDTLEQRIQKSAELQRAMAAIRGKYRSA